MSKRTLILTGIFILIAGIFWKFTSGKGAKEERITPPEIRVGILSIDDVLPIVVAQKEDAFAKNGLNVKIYPFKSSLDESKAMEAGELDIIMNDMIVQGLMKKAGVDTKILSYAFGANVKEGRFVVVSSPDSGIYKPEDLYGKNVAISTNTMMEYLIDSYEENLGLNPDKIEKLNVPNLILRMEAVIEGRDINSAILPDPLASFAISKGCIPVIDDTKLSENYSQSVILGRDKFIKENRDAVKKFMKVYFNTMEEINKNPDKYRELAMENARVPKSLHEDYVTPHFTPYKVPGEKDVERVSNWLVNKGLIKEGYRYEDMVTKEFIDVK